MKYHPRKPRPDRTEWRRFSCWWPRKIGGAWYYPSEIAERRWIPGKWAHDDQTLASARYKGTQCWGYRQSVPTSRELAPRPDVITYCGHLDDSYTPPTKCGRVSERGYRTCEEHHPTSPIGTKWFNDYLGKSPP